MAEDCNYNAPPLVNANLPSPPYKLAKPGMYHIIQVPLFIEGIGYNFWETQAFSNLPGRISLLSFLVTIVNAKSESEI